MLNKGRLGRARQRGLSLVELLVGIAVGLFIVAAAATMVASQLTDNRRLLLELQVQQDLRAISDIIARDIRRVGAATTFVASASPVCCDAAGREYAEESVNQLAIDDEEIQVYSGRRIDSQGPFTYKRFVDEASGMGVIKSFIPVAPDAWLDLTDKDSINITEFKVAEVVEPSVQMACPKLCDDGTKACWPTIAVRFVKVDIKGESRSDPSVKREVHSLVRLRNDLVDFKLEDPVAGVHACPL